MEFLVARIRGVDRQGRVGHDGFGPAGGNGDVLIVGTLHPVADVVQVTVFFRVDNLLVAKYGLGYRVPVGHTQPTVEFALTVQLDEDLDNRLVEGGLHGEARPVPVAACPQQFELPQDDATELFLPGKGMLQKLLAPEIRLADALLT